MPSGTYNATLPTDLDWVRFLIGDRTDPFVLDNGEIAALLIEEPNKYLAAARAGDVIMGRGLGAVSKTVGNLSLSFSDSADGAYARLIQNLREEGCRVLLTVSGSAVMRVL